MNMAPRKKARGNQIELYETLYDTITAWGEDYDALEFDKFKKVSYNNSVEKKKENKTESPWGEPF